MSSINDKEFEEICRRLRKVHFKMKESLVPACIQYNNEWQMKVDKMDQIRKDVDNWEKEFEQIRPKIERKTKQCIFFGETSCGKSSLINAILENDILPEGYGSISSCFVEVQAIPQDRQGSGTYLVVDKKEEKEFALLDELINFQSKNHLPFGSHIDLFYNSVNCAMLRNNFVLIDTPGIDKDTKMDERVKRYCNEADLIIMMVSSTSWLNNTIKKFIIRIKKCFSKLDLIIVYNFWDIPDNCKNREGTKSQLTNSAKEVLCDQLGYSDEEANERIHFLSAYERILVNRNDEKLQSIPRWQSRNDAFDRFNAFLQRQMEESALTRRYNYLLQLQDILIPILDQCHSVVTKMSDKIPGQLLRIKDKFHDIKELEEEIKKSTASIFLLDYNRFIIEALKIIKNEETSQNKEECKSLIGEFDEKTNKDEYKSLLEEIDENKPLDDKLNNLLKGIIEKGKEVLKEKIRDCIKRTNDEFLSGRILSIEEIYFPLYLDKLTVEYGADFVEIFNTIAQKIQVATIVTIGLSILGGALTLASGGVAGAIVVPVEIAVGIGTGTAAIGAAIGGGTSALAISKRLPFQFLWKKDAYPIRSAWENFEKAICNSYGTFLNAIDVYLSLNAEFNEIKNDLDNLTNEMIHLKKDFDTS